jgi:hypothetical protein
LFESRGLSVYEGFYQAGPVDAIWLCGVFVLTWIIVMRAEGVYGAFAPREVTRVPPAFAHRTHTSIVSLAAMLTIQDRLRIVTSVGKLIDTEAPEFSKMDALVVAAPASPLRRCISKTLEGVVAEPPDR